MKAVAAAFLIWSAVGLPANAAEQFIGSWRVTIEKDPFSSKKKTVAAILDTGRSSAAFAIRCFPDSGLSAVILLFREKEHFEPKTKVSFKYRADEGAITEDVGEAFGETMVELPNPQTFLADAAKAKSMFFRISTPNALVVDYEFRPRNTAKAVAQIKADCADTAPTDEKKSEAAPRVDTQSQKANRLVGNGNELSRY